MGTLTINATNGQTVAAGASYTVSYPAGKSAADYLTTGAKITTSDGSIYSVTVSLGGSSITITNPTGREIASGGFDYLDLNNAGVVARFGANGESDVLLGPQSEEVKLVSATTNPLTEELEILDPETGLPLSTTQTALDAYSVRSKGSLAFDWRTALSGTGYTLDTTAVCPSGSAVIRIAGEGTTDTTGNVQNNQCTTTLGAAISTSGMNKQWLFYARVPSRSSARKNYRSCPLAILLSNDAGFAKYLTFTVNAIADGKWRAYSLDLNNPSANDGSFVVGTDTIITARIRPAISNSATGGTSQLQVGESAYFGGVVAAPRAKAMAIIRFDDNLSSLYSRKACNVLSPYVGTSGVTVPIGSYSIYELVSLFGLKGTCFMISSTFGTSYDNYETVANLLTMQADGWEMCWQTHYNPMSTTGLGARLLGSTGAPWQAEAVISYTSAGVITAPGAHTFVRSYGETSQISLIGAPPAPLVVGQTYWTYPVNTTTFSLHNSEEDAYDNVNPITFATSSSASFGWNHPYATTDSSGVDAEFAAGKSAMRANGFEGWMHWAPNQGAATLDMENAWYANGFRTMWPIDLGVIGSALGRVTHLKSVTGLGNMTLAPSKITTRTCALLDSISEAAARTYVQNICQAGAIGQSVLHEPSNPSTLTLIAYLDELKLRQDAGEIEVATPSRVIRYLDAVQI